MPYFIYTGFSFFVIERFIFMLKGVNRQVVEIPQPDSVYFEKVIFFVKPEFSGVSEMKLKHSADSLIENAAAPPDKRVKSGKHPLLFQVLKFTAAATAGAVMSAVSLIAFMQ